MFACLYTHLHIHVKGTSSGAPWVELAAACGLAAGGELGGAGGGTDQDAALY